MRPYSELNGDQARQAIDVEQVLAAYRTAWERHHRSFTGSMAWKSVSGHRYLYRKRQGIWSSLGARSPETERIHRQFLIGRLQSRFRVARLAKRLDAMAPVNRALGLGRVPVIAGRILRRIDQAKLGDAALTVVGTNALFAYERLCGVQVAGGHLATEDIDLLYDARVRLKLLAPDIAREGVVGLLKKVDRSFDILGKGGFRAVNRDGYMVDLIAPMPRNRMASIHRARLGSDDNDLQAVEIEGLAWLVNSPKTAVTVVDERGYPLTITVPDPRAFALHKAWLAKRPDRDTLKRSRDAAQASLVAELLTTRLPHLRFDDPALGALPLALRDEAEGLIGGLAAAHEEEDGALTPGW